jgi:SAM-dependent methyltransferase
MQSNELSAQQRREIAFWRDSLLEGPGSDSIENVVNKASDAGILLDLLHRYEKDFARAHDVLELGSGQGWASCIVKKKFPRARVWVSDISGYALTSLPKWERIFDTRIQGAQACRSYEIPVPDATFDLVFCFAAAHHFRAHRRTLEELRRVLRPDGVALYLYEPSCSALLHRPATARVTRKRPDVPEDVLIYSKIQRLATETGLRAEVVFYPSVAYRSPAALLYYSVLARLPVLQKALPCTANYRLTREPSVKFPA